MDSQQSTLQTVLRWGKELGSCPHLGKDLAPRLVWFLSAESQEERPASGVGMGSQRGLRNSHYFFLGVVLSQVLGYRVPRSGITASYFQRSLPRQDYITYFKRVCVAKPRVARDISHWHHLFWLLLRPSGGQAGKVKRGPQNLRPLRRGLEC